MKMNSKIAIGTFLAVSAVSCTAKSAKTENNSEVAVEEVAPADTLSQPVYEHQYLVKTGDKAPDFKIEMITGDTVTLSELKGKVVMLQFTATWCRVCREEIPEIEKEIWAKHKDNDDFTIIAIDRDEPLDVVTKFAEKIGMTYPIGLDPDADIFGLYAEKSSGITRNVIIDRNGEIVMLTRLYKKEEFEEMCNTIDSLLAKK